jgi:hypothetical protein
MVNRVLGLTGKPPYVLHRLDMDTSGVLLFAKVPQVVSAVHMQFRCDLCFNLRLAVGMAAHTHTSRADDHDHTGEHAESGSHYAGVAVGCNIILADVDRL